LAEREIAYGDTGEYPVLLLDDVLSELDPRRQEFVLNRIKGGQVFITCCEDERLETMEEGRVFHIHNGQIVGKET
jgi:DNA replication and repair protein RecF